jgi:hypothetical protein
MAVEGLVLSDDRFGIVGGLNPDDTRARHQERWQTPASRIVHR